MRPKPPRDHGAFRRWQDDVSQRASRQVRSRPAKCATRHAAGCESSWRRVAVVGRGCGGAAAHGAGDATFASLLRLPARSASERAAGAARVNELISLSSSKARSTRGSATRDRRVARNQRRRARLASRLLPRPRSCSATSRSRASTRRWRSLSPPRSPRSPSSKTSPCSRRSTSRRPKPWRVQLLLLVDSATPSLWPGAGGGGGLAALGQPCPPAGRMPTGCSRSSSAGSSRR